MAALLGLPAQLLHRIIRLSIPLDFENLMLTCRTIFNAGEPQIAAHNARRRYWRHLSLEARDPKAMAVALFNSIKDPMGLDYVESVAFAKDDLDDEDYLQTTFEELQGDSQSTEKIKTLLQGSKFLQDAKDDANQWVEDLMAGKRDIHERLAGAWLSIFLLTRFPNVKCVSLPTNCGVYLNAFANPLRPGKTLTLWNKIEEIMKLHNQGNDTPSALANLEAVSLCADTGYDDRFGLSSLSPFLVIKGVKKLRTTSCIAVDDGHSGIPFTWRYPDLTSSLRSIEFVAGCMDAASISQLLAHTPHLETFRYSHHTKWHGCEHDWNAGAFVAALGRHCGRHLKELYVSAENMSGEIIQGVTSMKEFTSLERLELDVETFCGPSLESGEQMGADGHDPSDGYESWSESTSPKLTDILPQSLRALTIFEPYKATMLILWTALLTDFASESADKLPNLSHFIVQQPSYAAQREAGGGGLKRLAEEAGAEYQAISEPPIVWG
ncbi:hypothetical protein BX600DRAFT_549144 [Xylariales sp. PMI_506]|nr:hypothetical protein BX600DRAFT_549144 [Xylariales sp. PMI_506]